MDLSYVVDVFSLIAVVSGLFFAGIELRHFRQSRERESALELFSTFQTAEFVRGVRAIAELPENQSKKQIEELAGSRMDDMYSVITSLEGMGALVQKGEVSLELVEDFFSGIIIMTWLKLRRYIEDERKSLGRETWAEWTQWLAEKVAEREGTEAAVPAYIEYRDWMPG
jgi:hypothetical protein